MEVKIDKRTREYKDSIVGSEIESEATVATTEPPNYSKGVTSAQGESNPPQSLDNPPEKPVSHPKRRRKRRKRDFSHLKCGSIVDGVWVDDFSKCEYCGEGLETNEDGTPRHYRYPTPCEDCTYEYYTVAVINGKEVEIDPTDSPKLHFEDDAQGNEYTEFRDRKGKVYG